MTRIRNRLDVVEGSRGRKWMVFRDRAITNTATGGVAVIRCKLPRVVQAGRLYIFRIKISEVLKIQYEIRMRSENSGRVDRYLVEGVE